MTEGNIAFMEAAVALAKAGMQAGSGGPFGCVIVKDGVIVGRGNNQVTSTNDPTAHAEVVAIRDACTRLGSFQLDGCEIYTSCEPCPMCMGAIYWARPSKVFFASSRHDAAAVGFDDSMIYEELVAPFDERKIYTQHMPIREAALLFEEWRNKSDKVNY